jgi:uncharacterized protein YbaR (Trm112 family)
MNQVNTIQKCRICKTDQVSIGCPYRSCFNCCQTCRTHVTELENRRISEPWSRPPFDPERPIAVTSYSDSDDSDDSDQDGPTIPIPPVRNTPLWSPPPSVPEKNGITDRDLAQMPYDEQLRLVLAESMKPDVILAQMSYDEQLRLVLEESMKPAVEARITPKRKDRQEGIVPDLPPPKVIVTEETIVPVATELTTSLISQVIQLKQDAKNVMKSLCCPICTESLKKPKETKCGHFFCRKCIHEWIKRSGTLVESGIGRNKILRRHVLCPTCRTSLNTEHKTDINTVKDLARIIPEINN